MTQHHFNVESDHFEPAQAEDTPRYAFKIIRLNPGISTLNFTCCLLNMIILTFGFMIVSMLEPFVLLDKDYFNIDQEHVGTTTSLGLSVDLAIKMLLLIPYGHCSDRYGRKVVIYCGAASYLLACVILSSQTTIFPGFLFAKILLANGTAATSSAPLMADYTADESRGRAAGLMVLLVGLTTMFGNLFMKVLLYNEVALDKCYMITAISVVSILILNSFGLKRGLYHAPSNTPKQEISSNQVSIMQNLKDSIQIFKENGWIQIGLIFAFMANSSASIFFSYTSLYVKSLFSSDTNPNVANLTVNNIQTYIFIPGLICAMAYGYFISKNNKPIRMSFLVVGGIVTAFLLIIFSNDPNDFTLVLASLCMGASLPGILVLSSFVNTKYCPSDKRAIMGGFLGIVSNVCFFLTSSSAGLLYDKCSRKGPFILVIGLLTTGLASVFTLYKRKGLGSQEILNDAKQSDTEGLIMK